MSEANSGHGRPRPHEGQRSRLVVLRQYLRVTQGQFGEWLGGYSQANVSQWETGLRPMPYADIALRYGVSVDWLLGFSESKWGATVDELRRAVYRHLIGLPAAEKQRLSSPMVDPADRVRMLVRFCRETAPQLVSDRYAAAVLGIDAPTYSALMNGTTYAERKWYTRLAEFLALPVSWFEFGDLDRLDRLFLREYRQALAVSLAHGVTPERLSQMLAVLTGERKL